MHWRFPYLCSWSGQPTWLARDASLLGLVGWAEKWSDGACALPLFPPPRIISASCDRSLGD
jgi:hypothetical protein